MSGGGISAHCPNCHVRLRLVAINPEEPGVYRLNAERDQDIFIEACAGSTAAELGERFKVTQDRVRQIVNEGLRRRRARGLPELDRLFGKKL